MEINRDKISPRYPMDKERAVGMMGKMYFPTID